jgi:hypothetical protein
MSASARPFVTAAVFTSCEAMYSAAPALLPTVSAIVPATPA